MSSFGVLQTSDNNLLSFVCLLSRNLHTTFAMVILYRHSQQRKKGPYLIPRMTRTGTGRTHAPLGRMVGRIIGIRLGLGQQASQKGMYLRSYYIYEYRDIYIYTCKLIYIERERLQHTLIYTAVYIYLAILLFMHIRIIL